MKSIYRWLKSLLKRPIGEITLGRKQHFPFLKEKLSASQLNHHLHIVGASGFGKSVLLSHLIEQTISAGRGLLFVDLKSDRETIAQVRRFAAASGREKNLKIFSLSESSISKSYNLLQNGTPTQLRDRIMTAFNWSEEYYKNVSASFLLKTLIGLCWLRDQKGDEFGLKDVWECTLGPQRIVSLLDKIPIAHEQVRMPVEQVLVWVRDKENLGALQGLRTQLESLLLSDFGDLLNSTSAGAAANHCLSEKGSEGIDLFEAVQRQQIIYVLLDSRRYSETAKVVGRFVLQDLKATSAQIDAEVPASERLPFTCIIDEFSDMATEDFVSFLDRARSSKMSVVVAHQELADLRKVSDTFAARLTGNCSTMYAFLQKNKESVEAICSVAGTKTVKKETKQYEGFGLLKRPTGGRSVRETEEFQVHPNVIKSLLVGHCVVIKKYPRAECYKVRVDRPRE